jgi:DNA polymerase III alpha subunit
LSIPVWEVEDLKNAIIERSTGDARAAFCILDTFEQLEIGRKTLEKYPQLKVAGLIENHAKAKGQHAAGIVVTADPVTRYCSVDKRTGAAHGR